jgi:retron-type reverse transcriptase
MSDNSLATLRQERPSPVYSTKGFTVAVFVLKLWPVMTDSSLQNLDQQAINEMIELGFWSADDKALLEETLSENGQFLMHTDIAQTTKKSGEKKKPKRGNKQKQRLEKQRQQQKFQKLQDAYNNALAWHEYKKSKIIYLGETVSSGLLETDTDHDKLRANDLPVLETPEQLAEAMGISIPELRFLSFSRKTSKIRHYRQFTVAKKSGGVRRLSAPMPRLKRLQYWILDNILETQEPHHAAHGFVSDRSILTNAELHVYSSLVVNLDLEDFFPSIHYKRVKGLFRSFGYSEQLATIFALICTEYDFDQVKLNGENFFVGNGMRKLPQGAPTSPAISNLICRYLDRRLEGMAGKMDYTYTRYADDITFSSRFDPARNVQKLLWRARQIIKDEGFRINKDKTKIMRPHRQQHVTGLVVNQKISVPRKTLMRFRALLHQMEHSGLENRIWNGLSGTPMIKAVMGFAHYVKMVDPDKGKKFLEQLYRIREKYLSEWPKSSGGPRDNKQFRKRSAAGEPPSETWWKAEPKPFEFSAFTEDQEQPELKVRKPEPRKIDLKIEESLNDSFDPVVRERLESFKEKYHADESEQPGRKGSGKTLAIGLGVLMVLAAIILAFLLN